MMFLSGKGKDDYITKDVVPPPKEDPKFRKWKSENHMVMSWLISTMDNEISKNFLFLAIAKEVWNAVKEQYSDREKIADSLG